ncbi:hypothetical protein CC1G_03222 [Coprinopsis cinerea okayama7|uniref:Uncharacterized protein n=1 Tax=Coprinopsis cinerea (strain Okayama-7 / 130 / ATCC MYA-4618 / FGSC 9003) TaxID=240176 RepID=A8N779_COPC7|nr:hypothetical protein CC1G_03222 [Coprinopsis cinerea okayama7\|eukprot:XP_001830685.1 hypothetical protein CC1G_03222 [Coprinopsis cinerea okayama7\
MVDELIVECVYKEDGCDYKGERQLLPAHLKEKCMFSEDAEFRRKAKGKEKEHSDDRIIGSSFARDDEPKDSDSERSETSTSSNANPDTPSSTPDTSLGDGSKESPKSPTTARLNKLTEQNILLRHRVDSLENAMQFIRKEIQAVKIILEPWIRFVENNPRPATAATFGVSEPFAPLPSASTAPPRSSPDSIPPEASYRPPPMNSRTNSTANADDLASYFPTEDEVRVRPSAPVPPPQVHQQPHHQQQPDQPSIPHRPGHAHHNSLPISPSLETPSHPPLNVGYASSVGNFTLNLHGSTNMYLPPFLPSNITAPSLPSASAPVQTPAGPPPQSASQPQPSQSTPLTSVPNLQINTPLLLQTLQSMQSTSQTIASALEEVNRKSELALSLIGAGAGANMTGGGVVGEVLRLGEEIMGVRASVQGLRMQVHGMMMGAVGVGAPANNVGAGFMGRPAGVSVSPPSGGGAGVLGEEDPSGMRTQPMQMPPGMPQGLRFGFPGPLGITKL